MPLAFGLYLSAYYRLVVRSAESLETETSRTVMVVPGYVLRWPFPSHYNQPWLQSKFKVVFAPANRIDRVIRPDWWPEPRVIPNPEVVQASGTVESDRSGE
jgi:hypothetical protein